MTPTQDWSRFNRISVWVYPDLPGFKVVSLKLAFTVPGTETHFELLEDISRQRAWAGDTRVVEGPAGNIQVLDFLVFSRPGNYRLRVGRIESEPFPIQPNPRRNTVIAGLNFFDCERCGFAVRGIHDVCHQDWRAEDAGRSLTINGGWHDAGDLSQGLVSTSEAAWSMLREAERLEKNDPELAGRFREEARWGVEWMLKTRFGDGPRVTWATMDFWTDGIPGNVDDVVVRGSNTPFENFLAAAADAARAYTQSDPGAESDCVR